MNGKNSRHYKPGFFCALFWVICWLATVGGIAALFIPVGNSMKNAIICWGIAGVSAIISYIIRTVEKSKHDGRWSWHWFD